ncbi:MAG: hypothetical protein H6624_08550 [Bdellovibrionaceae bacterium]|nr:hypothetical protein [Bdellovibrionales bacterium]MCB9084382.1 hypothetical protein [Pseudobdellovibrionaceae bacterium]
MKNFVSLIEFGLRIILISLIIGGVGCSSEDNRDGEEEPIPEPPPVPLEAEIRLPSQGENGLFDPSLDQVPGSGRVYMSYSSVAPSLMWPMFNGHSVHTRLAYSDDGGRVWADSNLALNENKDVTLQVPEFAHHAGTWHSEVSKLAYDPRSGQWLLIWFRYLLINHERMFAHSWFSFKQASLPENLPSATEYKLMGAGAYDSRNNTKDGSTGSPIGAPPLMMLNQLHPELARCGVISEPGILVQGDSLYLAMNCHELLPVEETRIILLRHRCSPLGCDYLDPAQWSFVSTLLAEADAQRLGFRNWTASDLFEYSGEFYILLTGTSNQPWERAYSGCEVFKFSNLDQGVLVSDGNGPVRFGSVIGGGERFRGACAFHKGLTEGGILLSQAYPEDTRTFRLFRSFVLPQ